jgi:hypothetical protein
LQQVADEDTSEAGEGKVRFKAHLGAVLASALRHVITPPTISWPTPADAFTSRHGLPKYALNVVFSVHMIHDNAPKAERGVFLLA